MARLARINIHPIKSFDPQPVAEAVVLPSGAIEHDRRFALVDREGAFMNAKRSPAFHLLRSHFDPLSGGLELRLEDSSQTHTFHIDDQRTEVSQFLSDYFAMPLELAENPAAGFPDDTDAPGPTVITTETLAEVGRWFQGLAVDEVRRRFRANLEIEAGEPFWEDHLIAEAPHVVRFQIGEVELLGTNPCQRCPVPTRNSYTGEPIRHFAKTFATQRQQSLPEFAPASRFNHFYRLAVNTRRVPGGPGRIRVGDEVRVLGIE